MQLHWLPSEAAHRDSNMRPPHREYEGRGRQGRAHLASAPATTSVKAPATEADSVMERRSSAAAKRWSSSTRCCSCSAASATKTITSVSTNVSSNHPPGVGLCRSACAIEIRWEKRVGNSWPREISGFAWACSKASGIYSSCFCCFDLQLRGIAPREVAFFLPGAVELIDSSSRLASVISSVTRADSGNCPSHGSSSSTGCANSCESFSAARGIADSLGMAHLLTGLELPAKVKKCPSSGKAPGISLLPLLVAGPVEGPRRQGPEEELPPCLQC